MYQVSSKLTSLSPASARARICKRLWGPKIESEESIQLTYVAWRAGTTYRVVVPARQAGNRFLGSLKGLQIRAQNVSRTQMCTEVYGVPCPQKNLFDYEISVSCGKFRNHHREPLFGHGNTFDRGLPVVLTVNG
jgi:hypothetical protein